MFRDDYDRVASVAVEKIKLLNTSMFSYLVISMLAGFYVGFGVLLSFTVGGMLQENPASKLIMGMCFGAALSLVIMSGAELFTGNNLVMSAGTLTHKVTTGDALKIWSFSWLGNLVGAVALALLFSATGLYRGNTLNSIAGVAQVKMNLGFGPLFVRAILCNMLVCAAVWISFRTKSDSAKLIMVFWCLLVFFTTGFEHSIANMTTLTLALLNDGGVTGINFHGYIYNLITVTLGNMVGGIFLIAVPYYMSARSAQDE